MAASTSRARSGRSGSETCPCSAAWPRCAAGCRPTRPAGRPRTVPCRPAASANSVAASAYRRAANAFDARRRLSPAGGRLPGRVCWNGSAGRRSAGPARRSLGSHVAAATGRWASGMGGAGGRTCGRVRRPSGRQVRGARFRPRSVEGLRAVGGPRRWPPRRPSATLEVAQPGRVRVPQQIEERRVAVRIQQFSLQDHGRVGRPPDLQVLAGRRHRPLNAGSGNRVLARRLGDQGNREVRTKTEAREAGRVMRRILASGGTGRPRWSGHIRGDLK